MAEGRNCFAARIWGVLLPTNSGGSAAITLIITKTPLLQGEIGIGLIQAHTLHGDPSVQANTMLHFLLESKRYGCCRTSS